MKKLILTLAIVITMIGSLSAQMKLGGGLWYATDIDNLGISANFNYDFNEKWSAAPSFTYILPKNEITWMVLDLDANYIITEVENLGKIYALAGLKVMFWSWDYDSNYIDLDTSGSDAGVNVGAGLILPINENLFLAPEIKYSIGDGDFLRLGAKILFSLDK